MSEAARRRSRRPASLPVLGQIALVASLTLTPGLALAYTTESGATPNCHERITLEAWRNAMASFPQVTAPLAPRGDDEPLMADVTFSVPKSLRSIGPVTLLLGVRDNDLKQHGQDLEELATAASLPNLQEEHCLRAREHDEPEGSRQAVEACRTYIRQTLVSALAGLDGEGRPDSSQREKLRVTLAIRDEIEVSVPAFFLRAGRALHALQDSFTHTFRNPDDPTKVTVVLNFLEYTQDELDENVDGPAHASELDECENLDELRAERLALATEASSMALFAVLDPELALPAKEKAVDKMLDDYISFDAGSECSAEDDWCAAPELTYGSPTLGCHMGPSPSQGAGAALALLMAAALRLRRRRLAGLLAAVGVTGAALPAQADPSSGPIDGPASALQGESNAGTHGKIDKAGAFFGRVAGGASYDSAALSAGLGLRWQFAKYWMLGFDGEWNPYVAVTPAEVRRGSANAYASLIRRFQLRYASINIRTTVSAGASMLLFDLVGADRYSVGPYFGVSFLGVEWKAARGFYVTVDPTYIAIPIPSVVGIPFMYSQYRFLLGVEFGG
jgi:MYXO-CTERM domain-containing protein